MARRPFFGQGPGPLIARMDMNAATAVGREYGKAFREIGQAAGIAANSFIERQNQKKQVESSTRGFMAMGFPADVAKAMAKDPGVQDAMMKKKQLDQQMAIAKMQDATSRNNAEAPLIQKQEHWEAQQLEKQKNELADNQFISKIMGPSSVPTGQLNEAGQDELERGSLFIAPTEEARSDFRDALLKDPSTQTKVPMMDLSDNQFIQQFSEDSPEVQRRAFNLMQARQKDAPSISRVINMEDGQGGFQQVGVDSAGNPIRSFGPPKPSGMYRTPEEALKEETLVGRNRDAMKFNIKSRENSNIAISQAEQAQKALKYLPETTGGLTSFVNEMKVIGESLGINLPEGYQKDMADIGAFRQLTGQFLFEAMSNTKGAITEREMKLFRQISPDIDNSRAANKLMLEIYVKAGDRAKQKRDLIRDLQKEDVDPRQIQIAIEDFDDANSLIDDIRSLPRKTNFGNPQAQPNRLGVRGSNPPPNSNAQTPGGFNIQIK